MNPRPKVFRVRVYMLIPGFVFRSKQLPPGWIGSKLAIEVFAPGIAGVTSGTILLSRRSTRPRKKRPVERQPPKRLRRTRNRQRLFYAQPFYELVGTSACNVNFFTSVEPVSPPSDRMLSRFPLYSNVFRTVVKDDAIAVQHWRPFSLIGRSGRFIVYCPAQSQLVCLPCRRRTAWILA